MIFTRLLRHISSNATIQGLNIATSLIIIGLLPFQSIANVAVVMLVAGPFGLLGTLRLDWILMNTTGFYAARLVARAGLGLALVMGVGAMGVMAGFRVLGWFNFALPSMDTLVLGAVFAQPFQPRKYYLRST